MRDDAVFGMYTWSRIGRHDRRKHHRHVLQVVVVDMLHPRMLGTRIAPSGDRQVKLQRLTLPHTIVFLLERGASSGESPKSLLKLLHFLDQRGIIPSGHRDIGILLRCLSLL